MSSLAAPAARCRRATTACSRAAGGNSRSPNSNRVRPRRPRVRPSSNFASITPSEKRYRALRPSVTVIAGKSCPDKIPSGGAAAAMAWTLPWRANRSAGGWPALTRRSWLRWGSYTPAIMVTNMPRVAVSQSSSLICWSSSSGAVSRFPRERNKVPVLTMSRAALVPFPATSARLK